MSNKNSLKYQFKKQLLISVGLLVVVFSFLLYQIFFIGLETSMHRTMMSMAKHYAKQLEDNSSFTLPHGGKYSIFVGKERLPVQVEEMFEVDSLPAFSFSVHDGGNFIKLLSPPKMAFLVTHPIRGRDQLLYVVYRDRGPKGGPRPSAENRRPPPPRSFGVGPPPPTYASENMPLIAIPSSIFFIVILATLLVYWIVRRLISSVLNPLNELALMAKSLDEKKPEFSFAVMHNKTEIGAVAKILHQTIDRIHQSHQREKRFLQNASHELRTPIAVVSSALDIIALRESNDNFNIADQHLNIRRANNNMAEMTNALLVLSRKDASEAVLKEVDLKLLSTEIIDQHRYLLQGKKVTVELYGLDQVKHLLPGTLCRIVLNNLIRNAFEHTSSGTVSVKISDIIVQVTNVCIDADTPCEPNIDEIGELGFGIGLDIVQKIVEKQNWQLQFSSDFKQGRQVWICFGKNIKFDFN